MPTFKAGGGWSKSFLDKSPFKDKTSRKIKRAKRIVRKHVKNTTSDSPDFDESKFEKSEKKIIKADKLLTKAGYDLGQREEALGAGGYETAMEWAKKETRKERRSKKKAGVVGDDYDGPLPTTKDYPG